MSCLLEGVSSVSLCEVMSTIEGGWGARVFFLLFFFVYFNACCFLSVGEQLTTSMESVLQFFWRGHKGV